MSKQAALHKGEYASLLNDKTVKRWYDNLKRGSPVTADVYLRRLGHICNDLKLTPQQLLEMNESQLYELMLDTVSAMEQEGRSGSYIQSQLKAIKSWLVHNRIEVKGKIRIKGTQETPTLKDERVPTKSELKRILLAGDQKSRVACVLVACSGLRLEVLGNYRGDDGLRIRDLPELRIREETVEFDKIPTMIVVRPELSKMGGQYFTFLGDEGCSYLKDYLEARITGGESLSPDSAIITPKQRIKPFIRTTNIGDAIRICVRKAGFPWRPYVLRSYFDTQLMIAESKGLVLRDYRQFWMGHKGDIENRYTTNKRKLPASVIEEIRKCYKQSEPFLSSTIGTSEQSDVVKEAKIEALKSIAKSLLGIDLLEVKIAKEKELAKTLNTDETVELFENELKKLRNGTHNPQRIINETELETYLTEGWHFVSVLPSNKILLRKH